MIGVISLKKILTMFLMLLVAFSFMAVPQKASAAEAPTDEQVIAAYHEANKVYDWFYGTSLPTNGRAKKELGYTVYYNVEYPNIRVAVDLLRETQKVFTVEFSNALIGESRRYKTFDNFLFVCPINIAKSKRIGESTYSVERINADKIILHITTELVNPKLAERPVVGSKVTDFEYVNTPMGWRFATFSVIR